MGHATLEWVYIGVVIAILLWVGTEAWLGEKIIGEIPKDAEIIKVTGQQWLWIFEHEDGTREVNTLTLKAGKTYRFEVTSKDVIHAFNIPSQGVLIDAVPGRINEIWFEALTPGEYLIQCREYCGLLHYNMRAMLIIE